MNAIETEDLARKFWRKEAVRGIDLVVPEGSIYAFLGPNGAGKSTTIRMLMNLLRPSRGMARVLGVPSTQLRARHFEAIGYVSEEQEMPEWMTVQGLLSYLKPFYPSWDDALCGELLERFELPLDRKLKHLSRGMKMKVRLVSSIAFRPRLLVMDEPFSGLDPVVRDQLIEGVLELGDRDGWTVLISSHDLAEVENLCSHVGFLNHGRLHLSESLESVQERFREVEVVFEEPLDCLPTLPDGWLHPQLSGRALRFVDPNFDEGATPERIRGAFPGLLEVTASPMSLRTVFTALAKDGGSGRGEEAA
ncbi:MAG: ABC transporter ATP-binding protein [Acidobacteria bacterium]|nr:ABC transporter ATP-binding protein [Acidobacteriota bacterium]